MANVEGERLLKDMVLYSMDEQADSISGMVMRCFKYLWRAKQHVSVLTIQQ